MGKNKMLFNPTENTRILFYFIFFYSTLKSVYTLKWIKNNCPSATFILNMDDDVYINMPLLAEYLTRSEIRNRTDLMAGLML